MNKMNKAAGFGELRVPDEILGRVNDLIQLARRHIAAHAEPIAIFHIWRGPALEVIGCPFVGDSHDEVDMAKSIIAQNMYEVCADPRVDLVAFLSESWVLKVDSDAELQAYLKDRAEGRGQSLADNPKAMTALLLVVETPTFHMCGQAMVGKDRQVGPIKWTTAAGRGSRFADFFRQRRRS